MAKWAGSSGPHEEDTKKPDPNLAPPMNNRVTVDPTRWIGSCRGWDWTHSADPDTTQLTGQTRPGMTNFVPSTIWPFNIPYFLTQS